MKKFVEEPNLLGLGLSRRWEGAVIGILIVLLGSLLGWGADFPWLAAAVLFPGYLVAFTVGSPTSHLLGDLMLFGIPSITAGVIGSLIVSKKMVQKTIGTILLILYGVLCIFFSAFFYLIAD